MKIELLEIIFEHLSEGFDGPFVAGVGEHRYLQMQKGKAELHIRKTVLIWYYNGKYHRDDGPAVISSGATMWYRDGVPISKPERS